MPNHKGRPTRHNGAAVREFRIKLGITQTALAKAAGLSPQGLRNIELGIRDARRETLYRLARALDVSIHALIRDAEDPDYAGELAAPSRGGNGKSAA